MFDLAHAAFLTDTTRVITYEMPDTFKDVTPIAKHGLNHPGDPKAAEDAIKLDRAMSDQIARFVKLLSESKATTASRDLSHGGGFRRLGAKPLAEEPAGTLIGHGGGRIRQGETRTFPESTPLANTWLTMLKACGVPANSFADSTGTLDGLMS